MADQYSDRMRDEDSAASWRQGWAGVGAAVAALLLIALLVMITITKQTRDEAVASERHSYDVMLLTRTVDATTSRAEAALGRYVLDEQQVTGTIYYNEWRLAGRQIAQLQRLVRTDTEQLARVRDLQTIYQERGRELAAAAIRAQAHEGSGGVPLFYQAGLSATGPALRQKLEQIAADERDDLRQRMVASRLSADQADRLTELLGWLAVLIGIGAVVLGFAAYRAVSAKLMALREADSEAVRAQELEWAVRQRTGELLDANERLKAEASERESAEARLRQVQKMEAVGQLTGGIAHDFNNMLAVIVGGLDLAKRKLRGPKREVEMHLDNAMEGATRAAALTRRLLAFARAEPLLAVGAAPAELVEGLLDLVDRTIGERISVRTRFAEEAWHVRVDTNQFENAILNLAVNARDAMEGQGELTIEIDNVALAPGEVGELAAGDYVRISVSDTGAGISPENLERVFEPFFTTKPVGKGTGLGLSQIFGFARQSGGDVAIRSELNVGTTVSIYLPRAFPSSEQAPEAGEAKAETGAQAGPSNAVVLVVEDDPRVSRSTVGALEELGYRPIACASGKEALEVLEKEDRIELVITDVMMPEMTGPELVRAMSRLHPTIRVLFVTGYVGEAGDGNELSGYGMLRKPFTVSALAEAVKIALSTLPDEQPDMPAAASG